MNSRVSHRHCHSKIFSTKIGELCDFQIHHDFSQNSLTIKQTCDNYFHVMSTLNGGGVAQMVEAPGGCETLVRLPMRKRVAASLGKTLCYFPSWGQAVYPLWSSSLTKDMQTEQLLCWSGMTDTEHTTSSSNEEAH